MCYFNNYKIIIANFHVNRANPHFCCNISTKNFHNRVAIRLLNNLIAEIEEAFAVSDFQITDGFQVLKSENIPINLNHDCEMMEDIDKIFSFYGENKINLFQGERNETVSIIKCTKEVFKSQATEYFKLISKKKPCEEGKVSKKVNILKEKIKEREKGKGIFSHI